MAGKSNTGKRRVPFTELNPATPGLQFLTKVGQFFRSPGSQYLQEMRASNRMKWFIPWIGMSLLVNAIIGATIGAAITTDQVDLSIIHNFPMENIDTSLNAFLYFSIEIPSVFILLLYSILFFSTYRKYVAVFHPDILKVGEANVLRVWAGVSVYGPQLAGFLMVLAPLSLLPRYIPFLVGASAFLLAGLFARNFSVHVESRVGELSESLVSNSSEERKFS